MRGSITSFLIDFVFGLIEFLIAIRILLKLFAANPGTPFVQWVYNTSQPLLTPFLGMFPSPSLTEGIVVEFSAIVGLLVYAFIAYLLDEILNYITYRSQSYRITASE